MSAAKVLALASLCLCAVGAARTVAAAEIFDTPSAAEVEELMPSGEKLSGKQLYDRFIANRDRLRTASQRGWVLSSDPGGNPQRIDFWLHWKDYRDENDDAVNGVLSKTLLKVTGPRDQRHTGYLYIELEGGGDDQFMYSPNRGRTARVAIRGQNVGGSDFSFDDFLVRLDEIEDAEYTRHPDEQMEGVDCYVVEAVMKPTATSRYTRAIVLLEKKHYVPLVARYWDDAGVEVKKLTSPHTSIREFDGAWVAVETTVTDLLERTHSKLEIETLIPNEEMDDRNFSISTLEFRP